MIDVNSLLIWHNFNCYRFEESTHQYFYNDNPVKYSVTQFIHKYVEEFDREGISAKYAEKHNMTQEAVLADWDEKAKVSAMAGTAIHSWLENAKRGKVLPIDFSEANECGLYDKVKERFDILLPQAKAFHSDTLNKLFPIQLEYTVGYEDIIAGNIDMLCWNQKAQEFQIWDYKNLKEFTTTNFFKKNCLWPFKHLPDCHLSTYSMQLNMYKLLLQKKLGIKIGHCYLVHFSYTKPEDGFSIYECLDLQEQCSIALNQLIKETRDNEI